MNRIKTTIDVVAVGMAVAALIAMALAFAPYPTNYTAVSGVVALVIGLGTYLVLTLLFATVRSEKA